MKNLIVAVLAAVISIQSASPLAAGTNSRTGASRPHGLSKPLTTPRLSALRTLRSLLPRGTLSAFAAEGFKTPDGDLESHKPQQPQPAAADNLSAAQPRNNDASNPLVFAQIAEKMFHPQLPMGEHAYVVYPKAEAGIQGVPTDEEMLNEMRKSPLTNSEREKVAIELLMQAGAKREEIVLQDAGGGKNNIYVVKKGKSDKIIVLGAHHDKTPTASAGTIDNWTGTTLTANVLQGMMDFQTDATVIYALFAREEEGLKGSAVFLKSLSAQDKAKIVAMVNLDTLAVDGTYTWANNSDDFLIQLALKVAKAKGLKLTNEQLNGGDSDSSTFRRAGILGMTIFGCSEAMIWKILHSKEDTIKHFSLAHYSNTYNVVIELIKELSGAKSAV